MVSYAWLVLATVVAALVSMTPVVATELSDADVDNLDENLGGAYGTEVMSALQGRTQQVQSAQ